MIIQVLDLNMQVSEAILLVPGSDDAHPEIDILWLYLIQFNINTGCSAGSDKNYALFARARKQPIS